MTLKEYTDQLERRTKKLEKAFDEAPVQAQKKTLKEARRESAGTVTLATMRAMDHPKATRHGSPMMPLLPINKHQGAFFLAWENEGDKSSGLKVVNDSDVAKWLDEGTSKMFAHHFGKYLEAFATKEVERRVDIAISAFESS